MRLGELLDGMGDKLGLSAPVATGKVWSRWRDIVGDPVSRHAEPSSLKEGVLRIRADSPAWATEIGYLGEEIRKRANHVVGAELVREVKVWTKAPQGSATVASGPSEAALSRPEPHARPASPPDPLTVLGRVRRAWYERRRGPSVHPPERP